MIRKKDILRFVCVATLLVTWDVYADSMADQSAQPTPASEEKAPATEPAKETATQPASPCAADLQSDSPDSQKVGARCAAEKKDEKAVPGLINLVKHTDRSDVLAEALYSLAAIGEKSASTDALIEKSADPNLRPAERYIVVAAIVALRNDSKKEQILNLLSEVEKSDKSDDLLKDLATRLKKAVGG